MVSLSNHEVERVEGACATTSSFDGLRMRSTEGCDLSGWQHLARIEDVLGVEGALDGAHHVERDRVLDLA